MKRNIGLIDELPENNADQKHSQHLWQDFMHLIYIRTENRSKTFLVGSEYNKGKMRKVTTAE